MTEQITAAQWRKVAEEWGRMFKVERERCNELRKALKDVLEEIKNSNIQPETILAARCLVGRPDPRGTD
jgi:hypothetical protein